MTAGDLLYLEKALGNVGDMERSLKLAVRLSTGDGRISYEDLQKLKDEGPESYHETSGFSWRQ